MPAKKKKKVAEANIQASRSTPEQDQNNTAPTSALPSDGAETSAQAQDQTSIKYDFSEQVGHLLRKAYQRHTSIFQQLSVDPQLTSVQFAVLCALHDKGPGSLTTIGRATALDPATMRGVVERLRERRFVVLSRDPNDRRKVTVTLTGDGEEMVHKMLPHSFQITKKTTEQLNIAEQIALTYLLKKISGDI